MAFTKRARRIIGKRDGWQCQTLEGICISAEHVHQPYPVKFSEGWMVTAAHYPHLHNSGDDDNPKRGRILCQICHATEEVLRGNINGARGLLAMGVYTTDYARSINHQWYPTIEQIARIAEMVKHGRYTSYEQHV